MKQSTIDRKIQQALESKTPVTSTYSIIDESVQSELRLSVRYSITYPIDAIHYPKNRTDDNQLWDRMWQVTAKLNNATRISYYQRHVLAVSGRSKQGAAARAEFEAQIRQQEGEKFLEAHRRASLPSVVASVRNLVAELQSEQKQLAAEMRAANSAHLADRRRANQLQREDDARALASGEFWRASKEALKEYFHPPFARNYLADVSEKWRAALYTEMKSTAWKAGKGDWRHKNIGTGRGYLCGIDDNGDEWGHHVDLRGSLPTDGYGDYGYAATVEVAMAVLFDIDRAQLDQCVRQGDLLFCRAEIRKTAVTSDVCQFCGHEEGSDHEQWGCEVFSPSILPPIVLQPQSGPWEIRESHAVESEGLMRNGQYFSSPNPITITHTSHQTIVLEAGEYRLYELQVADAD